MKSTTIGAIRSTNDGFRYELSVRNYDHLRVVNADGVTKLLALLVLPDDEAGWLVQDQRGMTVQHCCYYLSLVGCPETSNVRSVTVSIPNANVFSAAYLLQLEQERIKP